MRKKYDHCPVCGEFMQQIHPTPCQCTECCLDACTGCLEYWNCASPYVCPECFDRLDIADSSLESNDWKKQIGEQQ